MTTNGGAMNSQVQTKTIDILNHPQVVAHPALSDHSLPAQNAAIGQSLSYALQSTLNVESIIQIFAHEVVQYVAYSGITFFNDEFNLDFTIGELAKHRCSYRLVVEDEVLGELQYSRRTHFTEGEIVTLEELICALIYPLRNGIHYRRAMASALSDPLTGVGNRAALNACLEREIELAKRHDMPLSVMILDVDHFKEINDGHGHKVGDSVIALFVKDIMECIRRSDVIFRYGGDEFVVILSQTEPEGAKLLAERIRQKISDTAYDVDGQAIPVTSSIGVTSLRTGDVLDTLFERADSALYEAKSAGRNIVSATI